MRWGGGGGVDFFYFLALRFEMEQMSRIFFFAMRQVYIKEKKKKEPGVLENKETLEGNEAGRT